jgi:CMP-N,N'-diacetyllegionaminic acid synthase
MKVLFIVPVRSGSKGINNKNLSLVGGKTLLERTLSVFQDLHFDFDVIVSSDSQEYLNLAVKYYPKVICSLRSQNLSHDFVETKEVIFELNKEINLLNYDFLFLTQVTSPFRKSKHILEALNIIVNSDFDSVVSITEVNGFHPFRMKRIENDRLINFIDQGFEDMRPRQLLPKVYIRNGAIYGIKSQIFVKERQLLFGKIGYILMDELESINIDGLLDLKVAEQIAMDKLW